MMNENKNHIVKFSYKSNDKQFQKLIDKKELQESEQYQCWQKTKHNL